MSVCLCVVCVIRDVQRESGQWQLSDSNSQSLDHFVLRPFILEREYLRRQNLVLTFKADGYVLCLVENKECVCIFVCVG